jgi:WS/DGAT/MGAT family acyltransferase
VLASLLRDPLSALQSLAVAAGGVRRIVAELQAPPPDDPLSACASGVGRRLAIASVPLATLQQLRAILGVTFNDILLTIVAGAVGRYHRHRRIHLAEVGCVVPVSLREAHERRTLGNRVTATNVALPVAEPDPFARLERIRAQTTGVRANRNGSSYGVLMQALPFIPSALVRLIAGSAAGRVHLICSNVAGPPAAHFLAGAKVEGVYPFAPILLGIPLSIAVLSYAGTVCIGIDSDPAAIADPDRLAGFVGDEIAALEREVALPAHVAARGERRANRHARPSGG